MWPPECIVLSDSGYTCLYCPLGSPGYVQGNSCNGGVVPASKSRSSLGCIVVTREQVFQLYKSPIIEFLGNCPGGGCPAGGFPGIASRDLSSSS